MHQLFLKSTHHLFKGITNQKKCGFTQAYLVWETLEPMIWRNIFPTNISSIWLHF